MRYTCPMHTYWRHLKTSLRQFWRHSVRGLPFLSLSRVYTFTLQHPTWTHGHISFLARDEYVNVCILDQRQICVMKMSDGRPAYDFMNKPLIYHKELAGKVLDLYDGETFLGRLEFA